VVPLTQSLDGLDVAADDDDGEADEEEDIVAEAVPKVLAEVDAVADPDNIVELKDVSTIFHRSC
jgi:hypothetical protein